MRISDWSSDVCSSDLPVRLARDGGEERLLDFVYQPIRDARGEVSGIFVEATDSTERARAEAALRESEERLKLALESSRMIGVWDWDVPAARIRSDERLARLCGPDPAAAAEGVAGRDGMRLQIGSAR